MLYFPSRELEIVQIEQCHDRCLLQFSLIQQDG